MMGQEMRLDAVLAYDRMAPHFERLSNRRRAYLDRIEQLVVSSIPHDSRSLLDIGAGDGRRAVRIAQAAGVTDLVLLEPSAAMRSNWPAGASGWAMRAEDLGSQSGSFDVITCLWNVLGHIFPEARRVEVLGQCRRLLSHRGLIFVDVNHRYNARHYGAWRTAGRMLRDKVLPGEKNGDVTVRWEVDGTAYTTHGHVFTHREFRRDVRLAGLAIRKTFSVDYETGALRRWRFGGNLLYVLERGA